MDHIILTMKQKQCPVNGGAFDKIDLGRIDDVYDIDLRHAN